MEALWIGIAFALGLIATRMGLPGLVGYLAAGFLIAAATPVLSLPDTHSATLNHFAHAGVLLLLFTVGLKINVKKIFKPEVIGTGVLHMALAVALFTPVIYFAAGVDLSIAVVLASALSFSSTVLAASVLGSKQELRAFHGRIAIGILVVQDLLAMGLMSATSGTAPSVWSLALLGLPLLIPVLYKLLDWSGHDERLLLFGLGLALVAGGMGFHALGLSGELGALVMGALIANHPKSSELYQALWGLKEVFLVGFFLTIGLNGLPTINDWGFALLMVAMLPLQAMIFFGLLIAFKLKARSAFLTTATLTNFSEFGLIVAAVAVPEWTVPLALAVALSFVISAPINRFAHPLFDRFERTLVKLERPGWHPDEEPPSLGDANMLVVGLGKVGRATYRTAMKSLGVERVAGIDSDADKVSKLAAKGWSTYYADAEHGNFWTALDTRNLKTVILTMDCHEAATIAARKLREGGFTGYILAHVMYADHALAVEKAGADKSYLTFDEAGESMAHHALYETATERAA